MKHALIGNTIVCEIRPQEMAENWRLALENPSLRQESYSHTYDNKDSDWNGTTERCLDRLFENKFDIPAPSEEVKAALENLLGSEAYNKKRRKRAMSEHDGEYDFDRQWDRKPFYSTQRHYTASEKRIELEINFNFHAGVTKTEIEEFSSLCSQIINHLENAGYLCRVELVIKNISATICGKSTDTRVLCKDFGEYTSVLDVTKWLCTEFYRRCWFHHQRMIPSKHYNTKATHGLGGVNNTGFYSEKGKLRISPGNGRYDVQHTSRVLDAVAVAIGKK